MLTEPIIAFCKQCKKETATYQYHGANLKKLQLCKECYDEYLAEQMVNYWKEHIAEEEQRTS